MSKENKGLDRSLIEQLLEADCEDPLASTDELISQEVPQGVDRRNFLIRSAVGGAAAVMMGSSVSAHERTAKAVATLPVQQTGRSTAIPPPTGKTGPPPPLSKDLNAVKKGAGPVLTTADSITKSGPGPSSSTRSVRCVSPTISTSEPSNYQPTNYPRRLSSRSTCSAVSALLARDTAPNGRRWLD